MFSHLLFILTQYKNSDVLGWWPLILYYIFIIGFVFALLFALGAMILDEHTKYTLVFSKILIIILFVLSIMSIYYPGAFFSRSSFFYVILFILLIGNFAWCFTNKLIKK